MAREWKERNRDKILLHVILAYGQPLEVEFEKVKVDGEEKRKILGYLKDEITKRIDRSGSYKIKEVEEAGFQ